MFGLSSDRIGTPDGKAWFCTVSKDLQGLTGLPLAPYAGVSYGTFDDRLRGIAGLRARLGRGFSTTVIYDGTTFHPTVDYHFLDRHAISLLWVDTAELGVAYSVVF